jgi:hypothetical protein
MALGFSFDAISRALSIRNYRIRISGRAMPHSGMGACRIALLKTLAAGKETI